MLKSENNWQFSQEINQKSEWRLFIKEYQSSPTELFVSAINEKLNKDEGDKKINRKKDSNNFTLDTKSDDL